MTIPFWKTTTVYQIYPRSFYDSNGDGIGDLEGIIKKLDYIQSIGFETIWISPFFKSPQVDFGYDIADYQDIDSDYGDLQTVERLIDEVHKRKMYVVFDMVMNHTSDQHNWFLDSKKSTTNSKADWYIWQKGKGKNPPNNWKSMTGGRGWHYVSERDEWYFATFLPFQPDLNYHNPAVKKQMFDIVRFWLKKGVDGFRLDIFNVIMKDPLFQSNPFSFRMLPNESNPDGFFQQNKYTVNCDENYDFARELRKVIDEFPNKFIVGEVFGKIETIRQYVGNNDGLNAVFIFEMLHFKWSADYFKKLITKIESHFLSPAFPVYVFSNHDKKRSASRLKGNLEKIKMLHFLQLTVRGVPFLYYGEEIGMENLNIPLKKGKDPLAKKYDFVPQFIVNKISETINRDEVRTPMQWNTNVNAGFSEANQTWLPVHSNYKQINVANSLIETNSLLHFFQSFLKIRKANIALQIGDLEWFDEVEFPKEVLAFKRKYDQQCFIVLLNFSKNTIIIHSRNTYNLIFGEKISLQNNLITINSLGFGLLNINNDFGF